MYSPRQMDTDEEENLTNKSLLLVIKTPECCRYYLPWPEEGRASDKYE
jgi:hypothetical protein